MDFKPRSLILAEIATIGGSFAIYTPNMATLSFEKRVAYAESDLLFNIYRAKREMSKR